MPKFLEPGRFLIRCWILHWLASVSATLLLMGTLFLAGLALPSAQESRGWMAMLDLVLTSLMLGLTIGAMAGTIWKSDRHKVRKEH